VIPFRLQVLQARRNQFLFFKFGFLSRISQKRLALKQRLFEFVSLFCLIEFVEEFEHAGLTLLRFLFGAETLSSI